MCSNPPRPALLFVLLLMPVLGSAQGPVFRSSTNIVEVAVVAKDSKDSPIRDLKRSDLRLFDNDVEQTILSFERMGGVVQGTGRPTARLSVILLDTLNMHFEALAFARNAVAQMIEKLPQGPDKISIFAVDDKLHLLHDFSRDKGSLRAAIDRYQRTFSINGVDNSIASLDGHVSTPPPSVGPPGGRGLMSVRPPSAGPVDPGRQRLMLTVDALREIARIMKDAPGQKSPLWVTAGFQPPAGTHEEIQSAMRALADAKMILYPVDARGVLFGGGFVDAQRLWEFAEQTGGRVYFNSNDTAAFLRSALEDSREGYILTYTPRNCVPDGSAHQVQLKTQRKDLNLRYRPGYVADHAP